MKSVRSILHVDMNNFYASVECLFNPAIRGKPVVVGGDAEARHGIVLAKNYIAKKYNIQTAESVWQAKQKCPDLVVVEPHFDRYLRFSQIAREIYEQYTENVESFGLDENWLDLTNRRENDGITVADEIRGQIKSELGVTVSVGVSFNKIFSKLGSDLKKPDATTVIRNEDFKEKIWGLPANELLNVGHSTYKKLYNYGVYTIGDLACTPTKMLENWFGKYGLMLWSFANGFDETPVATTNAEALIKSIGNSTTAPHDLETDNDIKLTLNSLAESVSARMREQGFVCRTVQLYVRDKNLFSYERQTKLPYPNRTAVCLAETAFKLFKENHTSGIPIRSIGVRACDLSIPEHQQLSLFSEYQDLDKIEKVETVIDSLRSRFGYHCIKKGIMLQDKALSALDAKSDNIIFPVSYL